MKLKNWIRRSFRNRVFATILVVTLVPLLLCDVVMMQVIVARAEHTQARQARAALDMLSQRFDEAAGQCGDTLEALATSTITRSVLRRTEPDSRLLYQFLYLSAAAVRSYADLEIYNAQGTCLYSTDTSLAAVPADTDWGGLYAARTNGGTVFLSTGRGLMAARTVTGHGGELLGYVTARIESSGFAQLFDGVMAPADDLLVLDGTWRTVYYTRTVQADRTVAALRSQLLAGQKLTGDEGDVVIVMSRPVYDKLMLSGEISYAVESTQFKQGELEFTVKSINGVPVIPVPSARMKSEYDFKTDSAGGFAAKSSAKDINWII